MSTDITVLSTDYYYIFLFFMGVQIKTKYFYIMSELFTNQIFFDAYLISQINIFNYSMNQSFSPQHPDLLQISLKITLFRF